MSWSAKMIITESPDPNTLVASGTATGTDDDSGIESVDVTMHYSDGVPAHMVPGGTFDLTADC